MDNAAWPTTILHVDMDAFYAAVEVRDNPQWRGHPVIVGGSPQGRGVVSAASYEARRFGVHSAMPMRQALRLCPQAILVRPRIGHYSRVSQQLQAIFARYTPEIEPLSLDEAFLDVTASQRLFGSGEQIARAIKQAVKDELQLVASVGVAPNKFVAKIASDIHKPDALVVVAADQLQAFLDPLPVSRLWGAGKSTVAQFERLGIRSIGQVRRLPESLLISQFGKWGAHLWRLAQGIDPRRVEPDGQAKSISHETTFAVDEADAEVLESCLFQLAEQVATRLRHAGLLARTVQLKLRYPDFKTVTRACSAEQAFSSVDPLWSIARELWQANWRAPQALRLIGVGVSQILPEAQAQSVQADLFVQDSPRRQVMDAVTDSINARFGPRVVHRGRSTERKS